jgi:hypothetical protein
MCKILAGKPEVNTQLGIPRRRWEDTIGTDLGKIGLDGVAWIHLAQDRVLWRSLVNTVMNIRVPLKARNLLTS